MIGRVFGWIDLKFGAGLLVGVLVVGTVVGLAMRSDERPAGPVGVREDPGGPAPGGKEPEPDGTEPVDPASATPPPGLKVPAGPGRIACPAATVEVSGVEELHAALRAARPGTVIRMAPGVYSDRFVATVSGTADRPIFLCGGADAVIDGGGIKKGYAFHLNGVSHWRLVGFTVRNSQKGVMADATKSSVIQGLTVHTIGDEAIHLRKFSTDNTVQYNLIYGTGRRRAKFGEGVYLGTAESNWQQFSGGQMDRSDRNTVRGNAIRATAEAIDIKEGTSGGLIVGNVFDGSDQGGSKHNDSWVDVKGNKYVIEGNRGSHTNADGFQTHRIVDGWGTGNIFRRNVIALGGSGGVGINDTAGGNTITCDNKVTGGPLTKKGACS